MNERASSQYNNFQILGDNTVEALIYRVEPFKVSDISDLTLGDTWNFRACKEECHKFVAQRSEKILRISGRRQFLNVIEYQE